MRFKKMMDYFEDYYSNSEEMNALIKIEASNLDLTESDINDVLGV